jgi:hypothetical protein
MTAQEFEEKTGSPPIEDELERVNCPRVGIAGHRNCGWCAICDNPAFSCAHYSFASEIRRVPTRG